MIRLQFFYFDQESIFAISVSTHPIPFFLAHSFSNRNVIGAGSLGVRM